MHKCFASIHLEEEQTDNKHEKSKNYPDLPLQTDNVLSYSQKQNTWQLQWN